ncbi:MAG: hypothetical protein LDL23_09415 [Flavobacterium sp.]|uniref:hypothetical protein n=1 Tax=Flavobacterium sp. TaxID=239 RepID=UPI0025BA7CCE|nr:hypothetical protein [Flavobacterium sp.]MCA1966856.1 hypothetical protein [Flavobacterium sp.]
MKKTVIVVLFIISAIHFYIKYYELSEYNCYTGKIIGFTDVNVRQIEKRGVSYFSRKIPVVEYTNEEGKKLVYEDGTRVFYSNFEINESVKVLEKNNNKYNVRIYSFFYYWIYLIHVIVIFLLTTIISGVIFKFILKK